MTNVYDLDQADEAESSTEQEPQKNQWMTMLYGLPQAPVAPKEPLKRVAVSSNTAMLDPSDIQQAESKVRELLAMVGIERAINLIREEGGQGISDVLARDLEIFDLVVEEELPEAAREIVHLIGLPHAIELFKHLGGLTFPVPSGKNENRQGALRFEMMSECIGVDAAQILCKVFGGNRFYIPKCQQALSNIRDRRILRDCENGATNEELSLKYRLTDRRIREILNSPIKNYSRHPIS